MNPIRSSLPSSSWLVATVVPWLTAEIVSPAMSSEMPIRSSTLRTPVRKPSAGSAGVDGVFVVVVLPVSSSMATTSVNVPPVSMPMRTRRAVMPDTLAMRYRRGKWSSSRVRAVVGRSRKPPEPLGLVVVESLVAGSPVLVALAVDPAGVRLPGRLLARPQGAGDGGPRRAGGARRPDGQLLSVAGPARDALARPQHLQHVRGRQPLGLGDVGCLGPGAVGEQFPGSQLLVAGDRGAQRVLTLDFLGAGHASSVAPPDAVAGPAARRAQPEEGAWHGHHRGHPRAAPRAAARLCHP